MEKYRNCVDELKQLSVNSLCKIEKIRCIGDYFMVMMRKYPKCLEDVNPIEYFAQSGIEGILEIICDCISAFHDNELIHGDLKPSNILINEENEFHFADYFCNLLNRNIDLDKNDISYYSPEILKNNEVSKSTDIWSIGCLIYYLLSGKRMFDGKSNTEIVINIFRCEYVKLDCEFSDILNSLIDKLLKINPKERISIEELKDEIMIVPINDLYKKMKIKGDEYFEEKEYSKANECFTKCLEYMSNDEEKCEMNLCIGKTYYYLKKYDESLKSLEESLKYSSEVDDDVKCGIYRFIGYCWYCLKRYNESLKWLEESLKYSSKVSDIIKCEIYKFIGGSYICLKRYNESLKPLEDSLKYLSKADDTKKCQIYLSIGYSYYFLGKYSESLKSLEESLKYSSKVSNDIKSEISSFINKCKNELNKH